MDRLADAVAAGEPVGLLGDYDVDGATSVALLARYLRAVEGQAVIDVPDRLREGYGPNPLALERLAAQGCRLVVTLDSGTTAFEALALAAERGLEVIVVDHHAAEPRLPPALAVINPNRCDQDSPARELAAVGVTFLRGRGAQPDPARARSFHAPRRARSAPLARPRGARHGLRRGAADRPQPGAGRAGPEGRRARRQSGPRGAGARGALRRPAERRALRLHARAADQRRRPHRLLAARGRAVAVRGARRGRADRRAHGAPQPGAPGAAAARDRGGGARSSARRSPPARRCCWPWARAGRRAWPASRRRAWSSATIGRRW